MSTRKPGVLEHGENVKLWAATAALAAALLIFTSKPVLAMDCVETQLMLTADYGDRYVVTCTEPKQVLAGESNTQDPNIAKSSHLLQPLDERSTRDEQIAQPQAHDASKVTTQAAQTR